MPPKNSVKQYIEGGWYHVYNRGVEKRTIFLDDRDYRTFLSFLKRYLDPDEKINRATGLINTMSVTDEVILLAYCLMPNHFHLLLKQQTKEGITKLMKRVSSNYAMYFNNRYRRVGPLFQGIYKAVNVGTDEQLLHLSRYIHRNSFTFKTQRVDPIPAYEYSSYQYYCGGEQRAGWVHPEGILAFFGSSVARNRTPVRSYEKFVEQSDDDTILSSIASLLIDSDDPE